MECYIVIEIEKQEEATIDRSREIDLSNGKDNKETERQKETEERRDAEMCCRKQTLRLAFGQFLDVKCEICVVCRK